MADDLNFMRSYFLKNPQHRIAIHQKQQGAGVELVDCVVAIMMFEITRVVKTGKTLYRKDQLQY